MTAQLGPAPRHGAPARSGRRFTRRIRIVQLLATGTTGGAQEHVWSLTRHLDQSRFEVRVVSLSGGHAVERLRAAGVAVTVIEAESDTAAYEALVRDLEREPADLIHAHMYRAEVVGTRAALRLRELGLAIPYLVATIHSSRVRSPADRELLRSLTPRMQRLIAVSRSIERKLVDEGRATIPIELIYNGVDLERFDPQRVAHDRPLEQSGIAFGRPLVGCVARLEPEKGHTTLLDAWPSVVQAVPAARLVLVGQGSERMVLERQAERLGLLGAAGDGRAGAPVVFLGHRDDVPSLMAEFDVVVLPSYREAQGLAVLEAMALGRPVVASAVGGIPEMIEHDRTGLLVPPGDPFVLAETIVELLRDRARADRIGRAGRDLVGDRFCVDQMVEAVEAIYVEAAIAIEQRNACRAR